MNLLAHNHKSTEAYRKKIEKLFRLKYLQFLIFRVLGLHFAMHDNIVYNRDPDMLPTSRDLAMQCIEVPATAPHLGDISQAQQ